MDDGIGTCRRAPVVVWRSYWDVCGIYRAHVSFMLCALLECCVYPYYRRSLDAGSTSLTVVQYLYPLLFAPTLLIVEDIVGMFLQFLQSIVLFPKDAVEYIIASALKRELRLYAEEYSQALLVHIGTMRIISHLLAVCA